MSEMQETRKPSKFRFTYILTAIAISCLMIGAALGIIIKATIPGFPTVIEPGSMMSEYSYVVFQDGSDTKLRDGSTGAIAYSSTSSFTAIQYAISAVGNAGGGSIYLKLGTYTIVGNLNITKSNITLSADPGTVILSSSLPVLSIWGPTPYGDDFDPFHNRLYNVHISNLQMFYTGTANITGSFVKIHRANLGAMVVPGGLTFENMVIEGPAQASIPTNRNYIGLQAEDYCGARFTDVSVAWFGTGMKLGATWDVDYGTWFANDGNQYVRVHVGACDQGIWYSHGTSWMERWTSLKVFACAVFGMNGSVPVLYLDAPHFEGFTAYNRSGIPQVALNITNGEGILTVISGEFQGIKDYGIRLYGTTATIMNCFFAVGETAIWLYYSNTHLIGNRYENWGASPPNHKVERFGSSVTAENDDYKMVAAGLNETNGANYFQVLHGLDAIPYFITITTNVTSTVTGGWSYEADPDYVTVYFANAGYYFVAWTATAY